MIVGPKVNAEDHSVKSTSIIVLFWFRTSQAHDAWDSEICDSRQSARGETRGVSRKKARGFDFGLRLVECQSLC